MVSKLPILREKACRLLLSRRDVFLPVDRIGKFWTAINRMKRDYVLSRGENKIFFSRLGVLSRFMRLIRGLNFSQSVCRFIWGSSFENSVCNRNDCIHRTVCSEGGFFKASLEFPKDYPQKPPKMKFVSEIWHPNIDKDGNVCISILHDPGDDK